MTIKHIIVMRTLTIIFTLLFCQYLIETNGLLEYIKLVFQLVRAYHEPRNRMAHCLLMTQLRKLWEYVGMHAIKLFTRYCRLRKSNICIKCLKRVLLKIGGIMQYYFDRVYSLIVFDGRQSKQVTSYLYVDTKIIQKKSHVE